MADISIYNLQYGTVYGDNWYVGKCNSAGGWDVKLSLTNSSQKTIKYIVILVTPINAVGDPVYSSISRKSQERLQITGPIEHGQSRFAVHWENVWYDCSIARLRLDGAEVTFMDGTFKNYSRYEISETRPEGVGGCYVATSVYGSYDCPQVWTLRRYRDYKLRTTWYGRSFIRLYYSVSPTIVRLFGRTKWFNSFWRRKLDPMVARLQKEGYEPTPYIDK